MDGPCCTSEKRVSTCVYIVNTCGCNAARSEIEGVVNIVCSFFHYCMIVTCECPPFHMLDVGDNLSLT